jgi:uncharacterized membrane protein YgdD (TMEM256/DUF423 family)
MLAGAEDAQKRLGWWHTAVLYHLVHAAAIALSAWLTSRGDGWAARAAGIAFIGGVTIFSGTLYAMTLGAPRVLGAITPIGGLCLIGGWLCVAWAAFRK